MEQMIKKENIVRIPKNGLESVDFAIRTKRILEDLNKNKGNMNYCHDVIKELNEEEAKAILKHNFYNN